MTSMTDRLIKELRDELLDALWTSCGGDQCPVSDHDLALNVDAVMDVIARRARAIHLCFPQVSSGNVTITSSGFAP